MPGRARYKAQTHRAGEGRVAPVEPGVILLVRLFHRARGYGWSQCPAFPASSKPWRDMFMQRLGQFLVPRGRS